MFELGHSINTPTLCGADFCLDAEHAQAYLPIIKTYNFHKHNL